MSSGAREHAIGRMRCLSRHTRAPAVKAGARSRLSDSDAPMHRRQVTPLSGAGLFGSEHSASGIVIDLVKDAPSVSCIVGIGA